MLSNAVLTKITGAPTAVDSYGDPTADGATVWQGRAPGYLKRTKRADQSSTQQIPITTAGAQEGAGRTDTFVMLARDAPVIEVAGTDWEASEVTIEDRRTGTPVTKTYRVIGTDHRAAGTIVDSLRLELEDA